MIETFVRACNVILIKLVNPLYTPLNNPLDQRIESEAKCNVVRNAQ